MLTLAQADTILRFSFGQPKAILDIQNDQNGQNLLSTTLGQQMNYDLPTKLRIIHKYMGLPTFQISILT